MAAIPSTSSVRPKEFHFPVTVEWLGEQRVAAHVEGKRAIEITSPPVFHGSDPTTWSPVIDGRPIGSLDKLAALARDGRPSEWTRAEWTDTSGADR
jgi:hypothetical protein